MGLFGLETVRGGVVGEVKQAVRTTSMQPYRPWLGTGFILKIQGSLWTVWGRAVTRAEMSFQGPSQVSEDGLGEVRRLIRRH